MEPILHCCGQTPSNCRCLEKLVNAPLNPEVATLRDKLQTESNRLEDERRENVALRDRLADAQKALEEAEKVLKECLNITSLHGYGFTYRNVKATLNSIAKIGGRA